VRGCTLCFCLTGGWRPAGARAAGRGAEWAPPAAATAASSDADADIADADADAAEDDVVQEDPVAPPPTAATVLLPELTKAKEIAHEIAEYANHMMIAGRISGFNVSKITIAYYYFKFF